jgi:hypothetical protein
MSVGTERISNTSSRIAILNTVIPQPKQDYYIPVPLPIYQAASAFPTPSCEQDCICMSPPDPALCRGPPCTSRWPACTSLPHSRLISSKHLTKQPLQWHCVLCRRASTDVLVLPSPLFPSSTAQSQSQSQSQSMHPNPASPPRLVSHSLTLLSPSSVTPTEGELFKRFSPELQKHNLENRERRQRDYEDFVGKLKEYSKSDKPSMSTNACIYNVPFCTISGAPANELPHRASMTY